MLSGWLVDAKIVGTTNRLDLSESPAFRDLVEMRCLFFSGDGLNVYIRAAIV